MIYLDPVSKARFLERIRAFERTEPGVSAKVLCGKLGISRATRWRWAREDHHIPKRMAEDVCIRMRWSDTLLDEFTLNDGLPDLDSLFALSKRFRASAPESKRRLLDHVQAEMVYFLRRSGVADPEVNFDQHACASEIVISRSDFKKKITLHVSRALRYDLYFSVHGSSQEIWVGSGPLNSTGRMFVFEFAKASMGQNSPGSPKGSRKPEIFNAFQHAPRRVRS